MIPDFTAVSLAPDTDGQASVDPGTRVDSGVWVDQVVAETGCTPDELARDTPEQIRQNAPRIQAQAVTTQIMPLGNITQMTQQERDLIGAWIVQGAQTN